MAQHHVHHCQAIPPLQTGAQGIVEALVNFRARNQAIHHNLNGVVVIFFKHNVVVQLPHLAIDAHTGKSLRHQVGQQSSVGPLLAPHHRGQQLKANPFRQLDNGVDHLVNGLGPDGTTAMGAVGLPGPAKEEAQVIVDLCHRAHRGARIVAGGFLIDGNGGREPFNGIHVGLVQLAKKLACIGGQALYVAPLTLSKNGVEREGRLAAATDASEYHQAIAGNGEVDIAKVMLTSATNTDHVLRGQLPRTLRRRHRSPQVKEFRSWPLNGH